LLYKDIAKLTDAADRVYRDPGFQNLRSKHDDREALIFDTLPVMIPEKFAPNVREVQQGAAMDKISRGVAHITNPQWPLDLDVAKVGKSERAETLRERTRAWLLSFWKEQAWRSGSEGSLDWFIKWGVVAHARCAVRIQTYTAAWAPLCASKPKRKDLNLDDAHTPAEVAERVNEFLAEAADITLDDDDAGARVLRKVLPFHLTYVPGHTFTWRDDQFSRTRGPAEVWEFRAQSAQEVLDNYVDAAGNPLAQNLARQVERTDLGPGDDVVVAMRSDRTHLQIFVTGMTLDHIEGDTTSYIRHGQDEIIWEGEHGLDRVPYAIFTGRMSPARELVNRFVGFIDPAWKQLIELNQIATEIATVRSHVVYPINYVKKHQDAPGSVAHSDRPAAIELEPGTIIEATGPGESLETVPLTSREGLEWLQRNYEMLMAAVERLTFGGAAYGSGSPDSGFLQNEQMSATTAPLEPYRMGCEQGYVDFFQLVLANARALHAKGLPAIPIRSCLPEGREWEELTPEQSGHDWSISVSIQTQAPSGKMAQYQALAFAVDRGWMTQEEAIRESGNPYPLQVIQQRAIEVHANSQQMTQMIDQLVQQQFMAALAQEQLGGMPTQPLLPPALAGVLGPLASDPAMGALAARLPQQFGVPGISNPLALPAGQATGIPGGPNVPSQLPPLNQGGGLPGQAVGSPGGLERQSILNEIR
jgi:hypothetical protein